MSSVSRNPREPLGGAQPRYALLAVGASIVTVAVLITIKLSAYLDSASASVLASLVDSVVDAGVSLIMFMAVRFSLKPADHEHRYGHGKIEGLAALFQAAFICGAGVFLMLAALQRFANDVVVREHEGAIGVMLVSALLSLVVVTIQKYTLRRAPSLAVEADQAHYSMDILVNLGAAGILLGLQHGAPIWIDPLFAVIIALYMAATVKAIAGKGFDMLLDRELPGDAREIITKIVLSHEHVMGMHDLRTHKSGMRVFISFDIELDPSLLLYNAHEIVREVEHKLFETFPDSEILIHVDPYGDTDDTRHHVAGVHQ